VNNPPFRLKHTYTDGSVGYVMQVYGTCYDTTENPEEAKLYPNLTEANYWLWRCSQIRKRKGYPECQLEVEGTK
jgi:hypothetical protein